MRYFSKETLERVKLSLDMIAVVAAGLFLALGVALPWINNTSGEVEVITSRAPSEVAGQDFLAVTATLKRQGSSRCDLNTGDVMVHNPLNEKEPAQHASLDVSAVATVENGVDFTKDLRADHRARSSGVAVVGRVAPDGEVSYSRR